MTQFKMWLKLELMWNNKKKMAPAICENGWVLWTGNDFGRCAIGGLFVIAPHGLLLLVAILQLIWLLKLRRDRFSLRFHRQVVPVLVSAASLLVSFVGVTYIVLMSVLSDLLVTWISIVAGIVVTVAWLLSVIVLMIQQRTPQRHVLQPLRFCLLAVVGCAVVPVQSALRFPDSWKNVERILLLTGSITLLSINILSVLFWSWRKRQYVAFSSNALQSGSLQNSDENRAYSVFFSSTLQQSARPPSTPPCEEGSYPLSYIMFWWAGPVLSAGYRMTLELSSLLALPFQLNNVNTTAAGRYILGASQKHRSSADRDRYWLFNALVKLFGRTYFPLGFLKLVMDLVGFGSPIFLSALVTYVEDEDNRDGDDTTGYVIAGALVGSTLVAALLNAHYSYLVAKVALQLRATIISAVYAKSLSISQTDRQKFSVGSIVNFMSSDTDRIENFCQSFHQLWSLPVQIGISLYLLYNQVQYAFVCGVVIVLLLIPINRWLAVRIGDLSSVLMKWKDDRISVTSEALLGIRVLKYFAWEGVMSSKILSKRDEELKVLAQRKYLDAWCVYFWATTPVLISLCTFATYTLTGNALTASTVFTSLSLFNMLITPLNAFPWVINGLVEANISLKRVQAFLGARERNRGIFRELESDDVCIRFDRTTWSWTDQPESDVMAPEASAATEPVVVLRDVTLQIKKGETIMIVGQVGAGKSSLLTAILGDLDLQEGTVYAKTGFHDDIAYAPQEPWIQHGTFRENVLFGTPYDPMRYNSVLEACALVPDLATLPLGDQSEIGGNGINLSGGQRARLSLARAIYADRSTYLLDDPLAAVDAMVGRHIFDQCIMGLLKNKTVLLCTHQVQYAAQASRVLLVDHGAVTEVAPASVQSLFTSTDPTAKQQQQNSGEEIKEESTSKAIDQDASSSLVAVDGKIVVAESRETGQIRWRVYLQYLSAVPSTLLLTITIASFVLMQGSKNVSDWWLSYWVAETEIPMNITYTGTTLATAFVISSQAVVSTSSAEDTVRGVWFYLGIYAGLALANTLFTLLRSFSFAKTCLDAARHVHNKLLKSVMATSVYFFDSNPIGRIMNRFSGDVYTIDDDLPFQLNIYLANLFSLVGTLITVIILLPAMAIFIVPVLVVYWALQMYYRNTSRELKRLESITRSPLYAHFSETLEGLAVIRAFAVEATFEQQNRDRLQDHQRALFSGLVIGQWLNTQLQLMGVSLLCAISFLILPLSAPLSDSSRTPVSAATAGLALAYALPVTSLLSGLVSKFVTTEQAMVSVERASEYFDLEPEDSQKMDQPHQLAMERWPPHGSIVFHNITLRYPSAADAALKQVSFSIRSGEKIGVVGRTGSGKSSLLAALFRLVPLEAGIISIDQIPIDSVPLHFLRSSLAIIPQVPMLFEGTLRQNIDPEAHLNDTKINQIVDLCHLETVRGADGLDTIVSGPGVSLSVGEKQLVCLARALARQAKILCLDEATASIDPLTDSKIQQTLRTVFAACTVIIIAHRINTVLDCDRCIVMDNGRVAEIGPAEQLKKKTDGVFAGLLRQTQL